MTDQTPKPRQAAIAFILVTLFIDILGIGVIVPVLPELIIELLWGHSATTAETITVVDPLTGVGEVITRDKMYSIAGRYAGVIAASYAFMQFIFAPIMGVLSDRFGRRPVILVSLFGLGIDFLIQGFATSIGWLFAGRILAGVMGANFTTANAYIADVSTDETRARNFGFMGMMFGLGFTIGPAIGGLLGDLSPRLPFFVAAGLALVNWLYGYFVLPESLPPEKRASLSFREANPFSSIMRLGAYPIVAGLAIVFMCKSLAQRGLENVWVLYTSYRYEWDTTTNGMALGLVGICAIVVQGGLVRPVVKRFGERKTVIFGSVVGTLGFLGYGLANEGW
ncbi:MAG: TCR/Tet family MFS transporter, partial [Rubripirellula sp.]|nr:TCR/Tet family MFS transporter [Rubripirellula sp.]